jgi:hypothetical protein
MLIPQKRRGYLKRLVAVILVMFQGDTSDHAKTKAVTDQASKGAKVPARPAGG